MLIRLALIFLIVYLITRLIQSFSRPTKPRKDAFYSNQTKSRKEGDVRVTADNNNSGKRISKDEGEYVDYEEL